MEGTYTEVLDNLAGNIFLAASKDQKFLLSHRNTAIHTSAESGRSNQNYIDNPSSNMTSNIPLPSSNPSDPLYPKFYDRKRDAKEEYASLIKITL